MPTWLAIAIPSVIAVATCLMWALDYSKKAHEIQKLRLELEKLKREQERWEREERTKASGLYRPTAAEVDRIGTITGDEAGIGGKRIRRRGGANAGDDDGASEPPSVGCWIGAGLVIAFLLYAVTRLVIDVARFFMWLF